MAWQKGETQMQEMTAALVGMAAAEILFFVLGYLLARYGDD
jgi:hypothetical protein